eukprot:GGOE01004963.1.p1 GENE.GGOE01004963.1~~GGOE01004963.1.p1  ORF type:complete len:790 (-),score=253.43 GGOE01004963.1:491-2794(-)
MAASAGSLTPPLPTRPSTAVCSPRLAALPRTASPFSSPTMPADLAECRERIRRELLGPDKLPSRLKKHTLATLLAPPAERVGIPTLATAEAEWEVLRQRIRQHSASFVPLNRAAQPFSVTHSLDDYAAAEEERPEPDINSWAEVACHPALRRLELFKATLAETLHQDSTHFDVIRCIMREYEIALKALKSMVRRRMDPNSFKDALFHVTKELQAMQKREKALGVKAVASEEDVANVNHRNTALEQKLREAEQARDEWFCTLTEYAPRLLPDLDVGSMWSMHLGNKGMEGAMEPPPRNPLEAVLRLAQLELEHLRNATNDHTHKVDSFAKELEKARRQAEDASAALKRSNLTVDETLLKLAESRATTAALRSRLAKISEVRNLVQVADNKVWVLERQMEALRKQEAVAMNLLLSFLERRGYHDSSPPKKKRPETLELLGDGEDVPEVMRGSGKVRNRMMAKVEVQKVLDEIWKDKKRWESANFQKCEFGPHYVRMLGAKYGVAGNTSGVGSLMILEYVYSLIDACSLYGKEDFEYFVYARLLKSEIPDELILDMNAKVALFIEILNKRNREYPRKELRAPKKGRQANDFAPLRMIFEIVEEVWGVRSEVRLQQLKFASMLFFNDGDVEVEIPANGKPVEWVNTAELMDPCGKFVETLKLQQMEEYDEFVEEILAAVFTDHPSLAPSALVTLEDLFHAFVRADPRHPKLEIKKVIFQAAGLRAPNLRAGPDGYVDMVGMDQTVHLDKFFSRFRRTAYVCKQTKTYVSPV